MGTVWWIYGIGLKGRDPAWIDDRDQLQPRVPSAESTRPSTDKLLRHRASPTPADAWRGARVRLGRTLPTGHTNPEVIGPRHDPRRHRGLRASRRHLARPRRSTPSLPEILQGGSSRSRTTSAGGASCPRPTPVGARRWRRRRRAHRGAGVRRSNTTAADYIIKDVFFYGGKEPAEPETVKGERGLLDKAWHRIATTFEVKNPKLYSGRDPAEERPSRWWRPARPRRPTRSTPTRTPSPCCSARNLGNKRLIPALFTLFNGLLFAVLIWSCTVVTSVPCSAGRLGPRRARHARHPGRGRLIMGQYLPILALLVLAALFGAHQHPGVASCSTRRGPRRPRSLPTSAASSTRPTRPSGSRCASI